MKSVKWVPVPLVLLFFLYRLLQYYQNQKKIRSLAEKRNPVVLIPGLGGSRLYDCSGNLKWCHWQGFLPYLSNTWRDELTVRYNDALQVFEESQMITPYRTKHWVNGHFRPTADFGGTDGVGNVLSKTVKSSWQFQGVINMCESLGYTSYTDTCDAPTLFGAPYDFRKITSPSHWLDFCKSLKALIEYASNLHGTGAVLLSHSMGSPLLLTFFVKYLPKVVSCVTTWKKKFVKRWVTVNGAFGGAGKAVRSFLSGDNNGMGYICDTGCHDWYQPLLENASGILWMLPSPLLFTQPVPVVSVLETKETYTVSQIVQLLQKVSPTAALAYEQTVMPLLTLEAPGVPVVSLTSTQVGTPLQSCYTASSFHHTTVTMKDEREYYSQFSKNVQHMCGDGTVPYLSLMVPQQWLDTQEEPVTFIRLNQENIGHTSILIEQESLKTVMSLIA